MALADEFDRASDAIDRQTKKVRGLIDDLAKLRDVTREAADASAPRADLSSPAVEKAFFGGATGTGKPTPYDAGHRGDATGFGRHTDGNDPLGRINDIQHGSDGGGGASAGSSANVGGRLPSPVRLTSLGGHMASEEWCAQYCEIITIDWPDPATRFAPLNQQRKIKIQAYDCRKVPGQGPDAIYPFKIPSGNKSLLASGGAPGGADSSGSAGGAPGISPPSASNPSGGTGFVTTGVKSSGNGRADPSQPSIVVNVPKPPSTPSPGEILIARGIAELGGLMRQQIAKTSTGGGLDVRRVKLL